MVIYCTYSKIIKIILQCEIYVLSIHNIRELLDIKSNYIDDIKLSFTKNDVKTFTYKNILSEGIRVDTALTRNTISYTNEIH